MTAIADYFAVEPIIVKHIKASVENLEDVDTPFDIENMLDSVNTTPSVSVIYYGDRMGDSTSNGKITTQYQQWLIVLKVHDAEAQSKNTNDLRAYANPFILQLLSCLQGFDPKKYLPELIAYRQFKRADSPVGVGSAAGFGYFPFLFEIQMFI